jgi:hypothetical protein
MWYATHAVAPCLAFAGVRARSVRCLGSGSMRDELKSQYNNPFPSETAIFALDRAEPLAMEVTRSLFQFFRGYLESFSIYGETASLEAAQAHGEPPVIFASSNGTPGGPHGSRSGGSPGRSRLTPAASIPRSCTGGTTGARTRIWCTSSSAASWNADPPRSTNSRLRTGRRRESAHTSPL